jgi:hypothetical protein
MGHNHYLISYLSVVLLSFHRRRCDVEEQSVSLTSELEMP